MHEQAQVCCIQQDKSMQVLNEQHDHLDIRLPSERAVVDMQRHEIILT